MKNLILVITLTLILTSCTSYRTFDDKTLNSTSKTDSNIEYSGSFTYTIGD